MFILDNGNAFHWNVDRMGDMKQKLSITSEATLDEIAEQLRNNLTVKQLADFVIKIGDDHTDCLDYWACLYKKTKRILDGATND